MSGAGGNLPVVDVYKLRDCLRVKVRCHEAASGDRSVPVRMAAHAAGKASAYADVVAQLDQLLGTSLEPTGPASDPANLSAFFAYARALLDLHEHAALGTADSPEADAVRDGSCEPWRVLTPEQRRLAGEVSELLYRARGDTPSESEPEAVKS